MEFRFKQFDSRAQTQPPHGCASGAWLPFDAKEKFGTDVRMGMFGEAAENSR